jgi:hypothetical protein
MEAAMIPLTKTPFSAEEIAKKFRVPYWMIVPGPVPRWRERPIWRLRALLWRHL